MKIQWKNSKTSQQQQHRAPTLTHDHAASRLVKTVSMSILFQGSIILKPKIQFQKSYLAQNHMHPE